MRSCTSTELLPPALECLSIYYVLVTARKGMHQPWSKQRSRVSEINKDIVNAQTWKQILEIAVAHSSEYDSVNTSTSLHRIAQKKPSEDEMEVSDFSSNKMGVGNSLRRAIQVHLKADKTLSPRMTLPLRECLECKIGFKQIYPKTGWLNLASEPHCYRGIKDRCIIRYSMYQAPKLSNSLIPLYCFHTKS